MTTPAMNLREAFDRAGADTLKRLVADPTATMPGQIAAIAQSILVIEQHLIQEASRP
jgi:hypothetical protein